MTKLHSILKSSMKKTATGIALGASLVGCKMVDYNNQSSDYNDKAPQEQRSQSDKEWDELVAEHDRLPNISKLSKAEQTEILKCKKEIVDAKKLVKKWLKTLEKMPGVKLPPSSAIEKMVIEEGHDISEKVKNPVSIVFYGKTSVFDDSIGKGNPLSFFPTQDELKLATYRVADFKDHQGLLSETDFRDMGTKRIVSLSSNGDLLINKKGDKIRGTILDESSPHFSIESWYETEGPYEGKVLDVTEYSGDLGAETRISTTTKQLQGNGDAKVISKETKSYKGCLSTELHPGLKCLKMTIAPRE